MEVSSMMTKDAVGVLLKKVVVHHTALMVLRVEVGLVPKSLFLEEEERIGRLLSHYRDNQTFPTK